MYLINSYFENFFAKPFWEGFTTCIIIYSIFKIPFITKVLLRPLLGVLALSLEGLVSTKKELKIIFSNSDINDTSVMEKIEDAAKKFQFRIQKLIFLTLTCFLVCKGAIELVQTFGIYSQNKYELYSEHPFIYGITQINTLVYVAAALAISCGVQLAYMLVTDGPDESVDPLMLGIASAILLILSDSSAYEWNVGRSLSIFLLVICMPILYAVSRWMELKKAKRL